MSNQQFPPGWDENRVNRLIAHYDAMSDEEMIAEDEATGDQNEQTIMVVPTALVPAVRELIAREATG
jgi:hypothetical protein